MASFKDWRVFIQACLFVMFTGFVVVITHSNTRPSTLNECLLEFPRNKIGLCHQIFKSDSIPTKGAFDDLIPDKN